MQPLQYLPQTLRISFEEGMKMLQEAGFEVSPPVHSPLGAMLLQPTMRRGDCMNLRRHGCCKGAPWSGLQLLKVSTLCGSAA